MTVQDIITRVQTELEDATGESGSDWTDADYIIGKLVTIGDDIAIRLQLLDLNYSTVEVILANIAPNTIDLSAYQANGAPLSMMILPKSVEWRLVGETQQEWTQVQSVDKVIDTDTGTGEGAPGVNAQLTGSGVTSAGVSFVAPVNSVVGMAVGQTVTVDTGALQEQVVITALSSAPLSFTAVFSMLHAVNAIVLTSPAGVQSDDPTVESYEWRGGILKLSPCSIAVDLRIRFVATAIPPTLDNNSQQFIIGLTNVYVYKCCVKICAARGVGTNALVTFFTAEYNRACADFEGLSVKAQQSKIIRLGGRRSNSGPNEDVGAPQGAPIANNNSSGQAGPQGPPGPGLTRYAFTPNPNGVTTVFGAPVGITSNSLVARNGVILTSGADYTFSGNAVTFFVAPLTTDILALYE
jgi:hypothetical protein